MSFEFSDIISERESHKYSEALIRADFLSSESANANSTAAIFAARPILARVELTSIAISLLTL